MAIFFPAKDFCQCEAASYKLQFKLTVTCSHGLMVSTFDTQHNILLSKPT